MSKVVYSSSIGTKWQSDIKYDNNRRKQNVDKKSKPKKGKK